MTFLLSNSFRGGTDEWTAKLEPWGKASHICAKIVRPKGTSVNVYESAHGISQRNGASLPKRIAQLIYNQEMRAIAIKKSSSEKTADFQEMGTLRCDGCGEEFFIGHDSQSVDKWVAEQQAAWLEKVLAEEHERDGKHADRIELPD